MKKIILLMMIGITGCAVNVQEYAIKTCNIVVGTDVLECPKVYKIYNMVDDSILQIGKYEFNIETSTTNNKSVFSRKITKIKNIDTDRTIRIPAVINCRDADNFSGYSSLVCSGVMSGGDEVNISLTAINNEAIKYQITTLPSSAGPASPPLPLPEVTSR